EDRQPVVARVPDDRRGELAVELVAADSRRRDDGEVALDVDVVRGDDDCRLRLDAAAELLHRLEQLGRRLDLAVRCDRADHPSEAIRPTSSSRNLSASTCTPTCALSGRSVTFQMSATVRPSQYCDSVSTETLQCTVRTRLGSITCATAMASWIGAPSKR